MFKLVVRQPFKNYVKGQEITDPDEIAGLGDRRDNHVIRVQMSAAEEATVMDKKRAVGKTSAEASEPKPAYEAGADDSRTKRTR